MMGAKTKRVTVQIAALLGASLISSSLLAQPFNGDPQAGKEKSAVCQACHGADGKGTAPQFPTLAGQYPDYLYITLKAYKSGERQNAVMAGQVSNLSDKDMRDLAAYYASMDGLIVAKPEKD